MFNTLATLSALIAAAATYLALKSGLSVKTLLRFSMVYCLLLIPVTGAMTGTVQAKGAEIPGWFFGVVNAALNFFAVISTLGILLFLKYKSAK